MATVQLFASYAEMLGATEVEVLLPAGSTVKDLIERIRSLPHADLLPDTPRIAINRRFAAPEQLVDSRDEIALIPPVAGG